MLLVFEIEYSHGHGTYIAHKWGQSGAEALQHLKKAHRDCGLQAAHDVGEVTYGDPCPTFPQAFCDCTGSEEVLRHLFSDDRPSAEAFRRKYGALALQRIVNSGGGDSILSDVAAA